MVHFFPTYSGAACSVQAEQQLCHSKCSCWVLSLNPGAGYQEESTLRSQILLLHSLASSSISCWLGGRMIHGLGARLGFGGKSGQTTGSQSPGH